MDSLSIVIVGEVDHGKSSLVGRLLAQMSVMPPEKIEAVKKICASQGKEFEYAFLMDAFEEEQRQGITIDVAHFRFSSPTRHYHLIDAPGHREFLKNMLSGSSHAHAAILLVDALEGVTEQTRRHSYLLKLLGIKSVVVAVNKMDLVDYSEAKFSAIRDELNQYLNELGLTEARFIPLSAKLGTNFDKLIAALEALPAPHMRSEGPLRFAVQDVYKFDERRIIAGRVESGRLCVGDEIKVWPSGKAAKIATIERWNAPKSDVAETGESIGLTLSEQAFVDRGNVLAKSSDAIQVVRNLTARFFWMGKEPLILHRPIKIKCLTQELECQMTRIQRIVDTSTLESSANLSNQIDRHQAAEVTLKISGDLMADAFEHVQESGRFVLVDGGQVSGGGIVVKTHSDLPVSQNIRWELSNVEMIDRVRRNGHQGAVVWLTGLSGSGKSTLAKAVEAELFRRGFQCSVLDGDNLRHGLNRDLGFSVRDRQENIRRAGEVAKLLAQSGQIVLAAFISPFEEDRSMIRDLMKDTPYFQVFMNCPLEICESRDPKGLYKKARRGELPEFTGVSSPFEQPMTPDLVIDSGEQSLTFSVQELVQFLDSREVF